MPTVFDKKFRKLAKKLLKKFGITTGSYTQITTGVFDDDSNTVSNSENTQQIQMSPPLGYSQQDRALETIQADDFKIFIAGPDWDDKFPITQPEVSDRIVLPFGAFTVVFIKPIYSGELIAAYQLQVRKGSAF